MRARLAEIGWQLAALPLYVVSFLAIKLLDYWFQRPQKSYKRL